MPEAFKFTTSGSKPVETEQVIGSTGPGTLTGSETRLPIHINPNVAPKVDATSDAGVQGIGPSVISSGLPGLEPQASTGMPSIAVDNMVLQLSPEEKEFILKRRANSGHVATEDMPMGNPRLAGGSDVFSTQSDKAKFHPTVSLERKDGTTREILPTGMFAKLEANAEQASDDFIPNPEPFVGQRRASGENKYSVQLIGYPLEYVFAQDRFEAQQRYAMRLGIISTVHPYTVNLAE